ncbi:hypothetical protein B0A48_18548 [Cryoendolithus antarcticus]|uniref:PD-(D/E)XK nuclease-like domain-containing protein n=1 Tax=Cryoendolithus antarcticus TaxID=1507870 RepID=A0A1V8S941_9PEZI|nr:hypothetical protein B0A48_18548 [Cryoendolithus antarcticus]
MLWSKLGPVFLPPSNAFPSTFIELRDIDIDSIASQKPLMSFRIDINSWVQHHAIPATHPHTVRTYPTPCALQPASHKRKRTALADMSPNRHGEPSPLATPSKRRREQEAFSVANDLDETPRAPYPAPYPASYTLPLQLEHFSRYEERTGGRGAEQGSARGSSATNSSSASGASWASQKRKRETSPQKALIERRHASYNILEGRLDNLKVKDTPKSVFDWAKRMQRVADRLGIIHRQQDTDIMRQELGTGDPDIDERLFRDLFDTSNTGPSAPTPSELREITDEAEDLDRTGGSEAAWNSGVHHPILTIARKYSPHRSHQSWRNVTTARIHPSELWSPQEKLPSKKVDFALALNISDELKETLQSANIALSQSDHAPIIRNPIAVSIETKMPNAGTVEGLLQVETWAAAQVALLRQLISRAETIIKPRPSDTPTRSSQELPTLPLILVEGHEWRFLLFRDNNDNKSATFYRNGITFGRTTSLLGCYQIIAGVQLLMEWAEMEYRPWMQEFILQPLVSGK